MIAFLTNIAPIGLGFIAKLYALKSQAASDQQKLMIENLQARNDSINQSRQIRPPQKVPHGYFRLHARQVRSCHGGIHRCRPSSLWSR